MKLNWKRDRTSRPGSATVRVTDLGWQGLLNPNPSIKEDEELLVDEYLSPHKLVSIYYVIVSILDTLMTIALFWLI